MRRLAPLLLVLIASPVRAQETFVPEDGDFPDRAAAIRPIGMAELGEAWSLRHYGGETAEWVVTSTVDVRVPLAGAVVVEASLVDAVDIFHFDDAEIRGAPTAVSNHFAGPSFGASFWEQLTGWRYEIGGSFNIPHLESTSIQPVCGAVSSGGCLPLFADTMPRVRGGWNAWQLMPDTFAIVAHARAEIDAAPELGDRSAKPGCERT